MKKSVLIFISILICSCANISKIDGLLDEVEVLRDNFGVNHIYANNQKDLFFMQGYLAAKIGFFNLKYGEDKPQVQLQKFLAMMN